MPMVMLVNFADTIFRYLAVVTTQGFGESSSQVGSLYKFVRVRLKLSRADSVRSGFSQMPEFSRWAASAILEYGVGSGNGKVSKVEWECSGIPIRLHEEFPSNAPISRVCGNGGRRRNSHATGHGYYCAIWQHIRNRFTYSLAWKLSVAM